MNKIRNLILLFIAAMSGSIALCVDKKGGADRSKMFNIIKQAEANKTPLKMTDLLPDFITKIPMPPAISSVLGNVFTVYDVKFVDGSQAPSIKIPSELSRGLGDITYKGVVGLTGYIKIGTQKLNVSFNIYEDEYGSSKNTFAIKYPTGYKPSQLMPELKDLDIFKLPELQIILSSFEYISKDGVYIYTGTNLVALVGLEGPMKAIGELKDKAKDLKSIVFDSAPIQLVGFLPPLPKSLSFTIRVPLRFGIDFTKIPDISSDVTDFLKKITTDDIVFTIEIGKSEKIGTEAADLGEDIPDVFLSKSKTGLTLFLQTGIQVTIGTQPQPLKIQGFGELNLVNTDISFGGKFPSMIEAGDFALGDAGIELYSDHFFRYTSPLAPITAIGLLGRIDLGKPSDARAMITVAGKMGLVTELGVIPNPSFVFDVIGKYLSITDLVKLLQRPMASAGIIEPIPDNQMPKMVFNKVRGKYAPFGSYIAGRKVPAGYALEMDADFFGKQFGFVVDIQTESLKFVGKGWMPSTEIKIGDMLIYRLTGSSKSEKAGRPDNSPFVLAKFNAKMIQNTAFIVSALLEVPIVALKADADIYFKLNHMIADIESNGLGFGCDFKLDIDPLNIKNMSVFFAFKQNFAAFLYKNAKAALLLTKKELVSKLATLDAQTAVITKDIAQAGKQGASATDKEITKTKNKIASISSRVKSLKKECTTAFDIDKIVICPRGDLEIAGLEIEKKALELYLEGLLKPGKQVIKGSTSNVSPSQIAKKTFEGLELALDATKVVARPLFEIREISGGIDAQRIAKGGKPLIGKLHVVINLPGLDPINIKLDNAGIAFDFNNLDKSAQELVAQLLKLAVIK